MGEITNWVNYAFNTKRKLLQVVGLVKNNDTYCCNYVVIVVNLFTVTCLL